MNVDNMMKGKANLYVLLACLVLHYVSNLGLER